MKKFNFLIFVLLFVATFYIVSADNGLVQATFDQNFNSPHNEPGVYYTKSIVLKIDTSFVASCKYTSVAGRDYGSMEGTFDDNFDYTHKTTISSLEEGLHKYYVGCAFANGSIVGTQLNVSFETDSLISAQINLERDSPLKAGQYSLKLITSKSASEKPSLTYSTDGLTYNPIPLTGSETTWTGYIVIPDSVGETVGSFRFYGKDLEGKAGETITKNEVFIIDTKKPSPIGTINIKGYTGQIRLDWYNDEDVKSYQIFRSLESPVDYTDYYQTSSNKYYLDNSVERGKTYYYRVAPIDGAGNIADLSREVSATALLDNTNSTIVTGLRLELRSSVDNLLSSIDVLNSNIEEIKSSFGEKSQKEKDIATSLQLMKDISDAKLQLTSLRRDADLYKSQDLTKDDLDRKINAANLRIGVIKKSIPETMTIQDEKTISRNLDETKLNNLILEYSTDMTASDVSAIVKNSMKLIKARNVQLSANGYNVEIIYMDGTRKQQTLVKEIISSDLDRMQNTSIIVSVPLDIAASASELTIENTAYKVLKDGLVMSFDSDTKQIVYSLDKKVDLKYLEDEVVAPVQMIDSTSNTITGNVIYDLSYLTNKPYNIIFPVVAVIVLLGVVIRLKSPRRKANKIFEDIEEKIKNGKIEEAKEKYKKVKESYANFSAREKRAVYEKFVELQKKLGGS